MKSLLFAALLISANLFAQDDRLSMEKLIEQNFQLAASQYKLLEKNTPDTLMPRFFDPAVNKVGTSNTKWWCSGFFPGSLLYIYEQTKDDEIRRIAEKRLAILEKEKYYTGNHDLGFMIYCSFGNAYRLFGKPEYKDAVMTAAGSLASRYRPAINSIQSWNSSDRLKCPVIIDNMMNLELLYWVSDHGGDAKYREIAVTHANTTLQHHFRPDNSSYHVLDWDLEKKEIIKKITWQGAADSSAWARGQSWGLYGYTMMYRFSKNKAYLEQAKKIANYLLNHPNLPADKIPYWDFNAPGIPDTYRDASAGAVMASALLELGQYVSKKDKKKYVGAARQMLLSLSSDAYLTQPGENGGFLIKQNVGSLPHKSEIKVSLTYADYYFLEAMLRYKNWYLKKNKMSTTITMYTDGSSRGNPGPGGYGTILMSGTHRKELSQGYKRTTNNRMELMAVIAGLKALKKDGLQVTIYSDSQYVVRAWEEGWLKNWIKTNFKGGKKNPDLWREFYELSHKHHIKFKWVKGHADNPFNNRCDELATSAADAAHHTLLTDTGFEEK